MWYMSEERTYWLVVFGTGSFGLGRKTWRAGAHEIDAETAREVLAWKTENPRAQWLAVMDEEPDLVSGPLDGTFRPEDLRAGFQSGVRFRTPPVTSAPQPELTPDDPDPPATVFPCSWCTDSFPSSARLNRHVRRHHVLEHARDEERLRAEFQAEQEARAAEHRVQDARPADLRPEERSGEPPPATIPLRRPISLRA